MSNVPEQLRYAKTHEWIREEEDGTITIGITDHAQELLGDLVYIELPAVGQSAGAGQELAVVESVKAASDLYSPVDGEVIQVNEALGDSPELVNTDPYGEGWILRLRPSGPIPAETLLDASAYAELAESESE
uniref:Glycine cleavage system H protein n=1 Tax=Candidatus Kentrum sp. FM TaxID=2126340 RepID=A0A450TJ37_9GAMM|nr:MAG: glycine cleavage system H protein [Candidatus Kentron sp. FM]VFJ67278.1 MAG: glycine cleavage system H protein [Candidatus Kentron sp. FM]VFK11854.1 MAG: glycine cleavage system H protein [Candidatus Kentron sp. FM]